MHWRLDEEIDMLEIIEPQQKLRGLPVPKMIAIIRHAQSLEQEVKNGNRFLPDHQSKLAMEGLTDFTNPLSPRGTVHAENTGRSLYQEYGPFDVLYHSDYLRTVQTANALLKSYPESERSNIEIYSSELLRERNSGDLFGKTAEEINKAFPNLDEEHLIFGEFKYRYPGGESLEETAARCGLFLQNMLPNAANKKILIIGHWGSVLGLRFWLEGWDEEKMLSTMGSEHNPKNCSVTLYEQNASGNLVLNSSNRMLCEQ